LTKSAQDCSKCSISTSKTALLEDEAGKRPLLEDDVGKMRTRL
jgi:hypothetical protein